MRYECLRVSGSLGLPAVVSVLLMYISWVITTQKAKIQYRAIYRAIYTILDDHKMDKWTIYHKNHKNREYRGFSRSQCKCRAEYRYIWEHHIIIISWEFCQIIKRKLAFSVKISSSKKNARANMGYEIGSLKGYSFGVQYMWEKEIFCQGRVINHAIGWKTHDHFRCKTFYKIHTWLGRQYGGFGSEENSL